jgi:putative DNA methylase
MLDDTPRLIESAFPLKQASINSVHEKNVRHGHISTLHIWPARRPLAACRAALIATLLPDPGTEEERKKLCERIGGKVVKVIKQKKLPNGRIENIETEETVGGILHWGSESDPDIHWFREKIREAYGGRAPKVLDPFAGGGAIPLEAMRLGCEATAVDINPVAWFILKCTLEYPRKFAGKKLPLPDFVRKDREFMESFFKAQGLAGASLKSQLAKLGFDSKGEAQPELLETESFLLEADLAWQVRAWGWWILNQARKDLARFYPTYADFEPLDKLGYWEKRPMRLAPLDENCKPDTDALNAEFDEKYLSDPAKPRWIAKPTVAYLWARTVTCKNCRATIPLLKTRWLCKKDRKRVRLTMEPNADRTGVVFGIENNVPVVGANAAQRREHDKRIGQGTMSRNGAWCPCCGNPNTVAMTMEDIRLEGHAGRMGAMMTAVVVDPIKPRLKRRAGDESAAGKEYRLPTQDEIRLAEEAADEIDRVFAEIPFGLADEPIQEDAKRNTWCVQYGFDRFHKLFTPRQLVALGVFVKWTREAFKRLSGDAKTAQWAEAVMAYLALAVSRMTDRSSTICHWSLGRETIQNTFSRFALPISWDFSESNPIASSSGTYDGQIEWIAQVAEHCAHAQSYAPEAFALQQSATQKLNSGARDVIVTDPPYYDAIGYAVLMDFFYVWLRRTLHGASAEFDCAFADRLSPKWDHEAKDGELIDDASRFGGDRAKAKAVYEEGMARSFAACYEALHQNGRLVIVFAHKHPDAWETLVSAIIKAGFVVDGSWPIQTEMGNRTRALSSAALSSSVWLVCKKRPEAARSGWDNKVLDEMRANITQRLRDFWDAGIRGPDFVWAATGPAMEAYSKYPIVKKANAPGEIMSVTEFLRHVRRIVVDFVVGRVLSHNGSDSKDSGLDDVTTYYLLHRNDFGMEDAPAGPCILYAVSCGLSDTELAGRYDILAKGKSQPEPDEEDAETDDDRETEETGSGSTLRLKAWNQRKSSGLGYEPIDRSGGDGSAKSYRGVPLIDQVHRLMHLWKAGDVNDVNEYLDLHGLRRSEIFKKLLQALIELAEPGSEERSILESLSNHVQARKEAAPVQTTLLTTD